MAPLSYFKINTNQTTPVLSDIDNIDTVVENSPVFSKEEINDRLNVYRFERSLAENSFAEDVRKGLTHERKFLYPKYFYDDRGSELFDQITQTEDYYPTRTEESILIDHSSDIIKFSKNKPVLVELGSGTSTKTRHILAANEKTGQPLNYIPLDVSDILIPTSEQLIQDYSNLNINGIISEYITGYRIVKDIDSAPNLTIFLGSSIGNFRREYIKEFLSKITTEMRDDDALLIGFDLIKDEAVLLRAYNDSEGVTAEFNLNMLQRINNELGGSFDLNSFEHSSIFNREKSRVEMHLTSTKDQDIEIQNLDLVINFKKGESIHTENSYKFNDKLIMDFADEAGLDWITTWNDPKKYFALSIFNKKGS
ncbi:MAG TPA: L-histidine N(alpha)-methyltransferase [Ignavibacteria bacterium]|nr:L-histidine N(alpha)-methyltransferase [Ignavibacteria bacterium]